MPVFCASASAALASRAEPAALQRLTVLPGRRLATRSQRSQRTRVAAAGEAQPPRRRSPLPLRRRRRSLKWLRQHRGRETHPPATLVCLPASPGEAAAAQASRSWQDDMLRYERPPSLGRVEAPPGAPPIVLLPGFGNCSLDYTAPFGDEEAGIVAALQVGGKGGIRLAPCRDLPSCCLAGGCLRQARAALPVLNPPSLLAILAPAAPRLQGVHPAAGAQGLVQGGARAAHARLLDQLLHHPSRLLLVRLRGLRSRDGCAPGCRRRLQPPPPRCGCCRHALSRLARLLDALCCVKLCTAACRYLERVRDLVDTARLETGAEQVDLLCHSGAHMGAWGHSSEHRYSTAALWLRADETARARSAQPTDRPLMQCIAPPPGPRSRRLAGASVSGAGGLQGQPAGARVCRQPGQR